MICKAQGVYVEVSSSTRSSAHASQTAHTAGAARRSAAGRPVHRRLLDVDLQLDDERVLRREREAFEADRGAAHLVGVGVRVRVEGEG